MKTKASITVKNKVYSYTLERTGKGAIHLVSKDARIDQAFLPEDLSEIILDLPHLIIAEQEYVKKQSDVIRFRVSSKDKVKIEKKAIEHGYDSVSKYVRDLALR
jgi:predicted DNA binding CopG/RHH family protein